MYKILIKINTRDGKNWLFYQENGIDYSGSTLAEVKDKALELLNQYGRDNIKITDEKCGDDMNNVISYVFGSAGGASNYNDLTNKPKINNVELRGNKSLSDLGIINFSGNYNDLSNKPIIPTKTSDLTNDSGYIDSTYHDSSKQDVLIAGANITIENNVISSTGGSVLPQYPAFDLTKRYTLVLAPNLLGTAYELKWIEIGSGGESQLVTSDGKNFVTSNGDNFIVREEI